MMRVIRQLSLGAFTLFVGLAGFAAGLSYNKLPPGNHLVRVLLRDKTPLLGGEDASGQPTGLMSFLYFLLPNNTQWAVKVEANGIIPTLRRITGW